MTDHDQAPAEPGRTPDVGLAEKAVLGTILGSRTAAEAVDAVLTASCFADTVHQAVYAAVCHVLSTGQPVDPVSVLSRLVAAEQGIWRTGQAGVILANLYEHATPSYMTHALKVLDAARQRRLHEAMLRGARLAARPGADIEEVAGQIRRLVDEAADTGTRRDGLRSQAEILAEVMERLESGTEPGLKTGYRDLDEATGGLRPGTLTVIGARPGVGKTVLAGCIADHVGTRLHLPVLFASLEMTAGELMHRRIAARARVPLDSLTKGTLTERDWDRINTAYDWLAGSRLLVDDEPGVPLAHVTARLRAMERADDPARLLVIDYLGLLKEPQGADTRQSAVAEMARECKNIARRHSLPVILLAQLRRESEHRPGKVPLLSDLKESGEIEAAADIVLLLHREDYYERESPRAGEADIHVSKNRQGPQCVITMQFQGHYGRMVGMASDDLRESGDWTPLSAAGGAA